jgi:competence protein ComEC
MRPLVPLVISFILGIVISERAVFGYGALTLLLFLSVVPIFIAILWKWQFRTYLVLPPFFLLGVLFILPIARPDFPPDHVLNSIGKGAGPLGVRVEGVVSSVPEVRGDNVRLYVDAVRAESDREDRLEDSPTPGGTFQAVTGRILLTVEGIEAGLKKGDRIVFIARLKEPRNFGNPGGFDYEWWLKRKGVFLTGYVKQGLLVKINEGRQGPLSLIGEWREDVRTLVDSSDLKNSELIKALIIGQRSGIPEDIKEVFRRTGAAHILAISGLHVGLVAYFAYTIILWLLKRSEGLMLALNVKKVAVVLAMVPVLLYGAIAGFSLPTQRAVIMVGAFVFTLLIDREKDLLNTLALAALVILLVSPGSLWDISFQLSFAAVLGIIYLVSGIKAFFETEEEETGPVLWRRRLSERVKIFFLVTLTAIISTAPILAFHFHRVSLVGLITNLFVVPLVGFVAVPLGLLSAFILPLWEGLSMMILRVSDITLGATVWALKFFSKLPYSSVWLATPTVFEIILFYLLIVCIVGIKKRRFVLYAVPAVALVIFLDLGFWHYRGIWDRDLKVTFIRDSALVELPPDRWGRRETMLIDGGGIYGTGFDTGKMVVAPVLWKKKIKKIDYIVLSHPQRDHLEGLKFIAGNFNPREETTWRVSNLSPRTLIPGSSGGTAIEGALAGLKRYLLGTAQRS